MTNITTRTTTSITRELDNPDSPLRALLKTHQVLLNSWRHQLLDQLSGKPWIRPQRTNMAWMAGHAIDYRTRWLLTGITALPDPVIYGLRHCTEQTSSALLEVFDTIAGLPAGPLTPEHERAVCKVAIAAASVEPLYRAGMVRCALDELGYEAFQAEHRDVLADVIALAAGLPSLVGRYETCSIADGPITATGRMAGDADFTADTEVVEIKCTINPRGSATRAVQQLLVYAARLQSRSAAILLPRQHTLVRFDLELDLDRMSLLDTEIQAAYGP